MGRRHIIKGSASKGLERVCTREKVEKFQAYHHFIFGGFYTGERLEGGEILEGKVAVRILVCAFREDGSF